MKKAIILGTRPEIIKLSPILRRLDKDDFIIHTNQHYDENMDKNFFDELKLNTSNFNLNVGSASHGVQTARMLEGIEKILFNEKPDVVIVQGDTNSSLSGALAAAKMHIKVAHIEAGLRSYDKEMPEEINRIMIDHISDFLFVPTLLSYNILLKEGISSEKIYLVGNTIVDATLENSKLIKENSSDEKYILITLHRVENTDNLFRLKRIISQINSISEEYKMIFPIHPRTKKILDKENIMLSKNIKIMEPQGYLSFLSLIKNSCIVLSDSGGVQEEACLLQVPCITLRTSTERPETIDIGANKLMSDSIDDDIKEMLSRPRSWNNPFGNNVAEKIMGVLK